MFSLILPFHSDVSRLFRTFDLLAQDQGRHKIGEILLCHNGAPLPAESKRVLQSKMIPTARLLHTDDKGIGAGYRLGISNAASDYCVLSASDLPFGFTDIASFLSLAEQQGRLPDLAIGSKAHPLSKISGYGLTRRMASMGFWAFRAALLGRNTPKDSQGSILVKTTLASKALPLIEADNYFFSVELITLLQKQGVPAVELPVILENHEGDSSVSVVNDSLQLAKDLVRFSKRIKKT